MRILHFRSILSRILVATVTLTVIFPGLVQADPVLKAIAQSRRKFPVTTKPLRMGSFGAPGINTRGVVVFYSTAYGTGINAGNNGFIGRINKKKGRVIARKGQTAPFNSPSFTLTQLNTSPHINSQMRVAWSGIYQSVTLIGKEQEITTNTYLFYTYKSGSTGTYTRYPDQKIPDLTLDLNSRGFITVTAGDLSRPDAPVSLFRLSASTRTPLVSVGETAIGLPLGSNFTAFGIPTIDDNNAVYFAASVSENDSKFDGIWYGRTGDPQPLVLKGQSTSSDSTSSKPTSETFTAFAEPPVPAPSGKLLAFSGSTSKGANSGIWSVDVATGKLTTIAQAGDQAEGYSEALSNFQPPAINNAGQVAFGIKGATATTSTSIERVSALFFASAAGEVKKIIANGDEVTINGKTVKVIDIRFAPTRGLNNLGQVAFTASFDNRTSGVFVAKP